MCLSDTYIPRKRKQNRVRFEALTAVSMKNAVFWDVAPCRSCLLPPVHVGFFARGFFCPEDGGDAFLRNVGSHKIYTAPDPTRRHFSKLK
jgi:hypothetical protein